MRQERREEAEYRNALAYKNIYSNRLLLSFVLDKCSDRSTEVYLPALLVMYDRPTDQSNNYQPMK